MFDTRCVAGILNESVVLGLLGSDITGCMIGITEGISVEMMYVRQPK